MFTLGQVLPMLTGDFRSFSEPIVSLGLGIFNLRMEFGLAEGDLVEVLHAKGSREGHGGFLLTVKGQVAEKEIFHHGVVGHFIVGGHRGRFFSRRGGDRTLKRHGRNILQSSEKRESRGSF